MKSPIRTIDRWAPRSVFLVDALGAAVTAATHGLLLVRLDSMLGIGSNLLRALASAREDHLCHKQRARLRIITEANGVRR